jgi:hypothetical protein
MAVEALLDLVPGGPGDPLQEGESLQDHPRGAESALEGILVDERLLDGVQPAVLGQAFDRDDLGAGPGL